MKHFNRREILKGLTLLGIGALSSNILKLGADDNPESRRLSGRDAKDKTTSKTILSVVESDKIPEGVKESLNIALSAIGGLSNLVKKGSVVVIKPNMAWERPPELAANTNPEVVSTVIKECFSAGAKKVKIVERTCNDPKRCYAMSGIEKVVKETGAEMVLLSNNPKEYREIIFPDAKELKSWLIAKDVLECDVLINIPIAKHHGLTKLTLGIKNLMGVMGGKRGGIHHLISQKMADVLTLVKPHLTIIDAYRVLVRNGPTGGNPQDVVYLKKFIASLDPVATDSYASTIEPFKLKPHDIGYIKASYEMGLGEMDIAKLNVVEKKL
ncbi:MAG: DUF362 domain-containing protein [Planctomycetota bacterium]|nr:DUF362 domain-containing protein [Planctomycetota bacterium]MDI6788180.1 DUF362 domain-containing protein [Planctomycetota bacterium]